MNDDQNSNTFCARELFLASALYDGLEDCNIRWGVFNCPFKYVWWY